MRKRLVLCLDGTWNSRDDSTNVFHLYNLVIQGLVDDRKVVQEKKYDEGVGTGLLDSVSGGAFGFGLEENVREALNWLIERYDDGDEIHVFGFSRGAYTARSLVGFIARCGLPHRGCPLPLDQLWRAYRVLGRSEEDRDSWWERAFGREEPPFRKLTDLVFDNGKPKSEATWNADERLLVKWSRRVPIHCLGLFDTVGSMGSDALAIPGLRSRLAMHHNMNLTTLIRHGFHALAIDEHRSNFTHSPMREFFWNDRPETKFAGKITQRWFAGSHSNVGGGYDSNISTLFALEWMARQAQDVGLVLDEDAMGRLEQAKNAGWPEGKSIDAVAPLRDSYAEFASPLWTHLVRAKPEYRHIAPVPETRGPTRKNADGSTRGYTLVCVGEEVDESALELIKANPSYRPPNLVEHLKRAKPEKAREMNLEFSSIHPWAAGSLGGKLLLVLWASLAAWGFVMAQDAFCLALPLSLMPIVAFFLVAVDGAESHLNFQSVRGSLPPWQQACLDSLYWLRTIGTVLFFIGTLAALWQTLSWVWTQGRTTWADLAACWQQLLGVPAAAGLATLLVGWTTESRPLNVDPRRKPVSAREKAFIAGVLGTIAFLIPVWWQQITGSSAVALPTWRGLVPSSDESLAGHLLLVFVLFFYVMDSFWWIGEPMDRARLGSIVLLQKCKIPADFAGCLDRWLQMLKREDLPGEPPGDPTSRASALLGRTLRLALWRDMIGFIPIYTALYLAALWFLHTGLLVPRLPAWEEFCRNHWLASSSWWLLPAFVAAADYAEDFFHLRLLRCLPGDASRSVTTPSASLARCSRCVTVAKFAGVIPCALLSLVAILWGGWELLTGSNHGGWRATLDLLAWAIVLLGFLVQIIIWRRSSSKTMNNDSNSPPPDNAGGSHVMNEKGLREETKEAVKEGNLFVSIVGGVWLFLFLNVIVPHTGSKDHSAADDGEKLESTYRNLILTLKHGEVWQPPISWAQVRSAMAASKESSDGPQAPSFDERANQPVADYSHDKQQRDVEAALLFPTGPVMDESSRLERLAKASDSLRKLLEEREQEAIDIPGLGKVSEVRVLVLFPVLTLILISGTAMCRSRLLRIGISHERPPLWSYPLPLSLVIMPLHRWRFWNGVGLFCLLVVLYVTLEFGAWNPLQSMAGQGNEREMVITYLAMLLSIIVFLHSCLDAWRRDRHNETAQPG